MAKYIYPAIFKPEEGMFSINFPDIENCYTCGDDIEDGIEMASDVLALTLVHLENDEKVIPKPSSINNLKMTDEEFATLISCDTTVYRRLMKNTAVRKTLTIPEWLNEAATAAGVNFSQVLQDALKTQLNLA